MAKVGILSAISLDSDSFDIADYAVNPLLARFAIKGLSQKLQ